MKKLFVFLFALFCMSGQFTITAFADQIELKYEFIHANSDKKIAREIEKAQGLDNSLKILIATEQDVVNKYKNYDEKASSPEPVEYTIEETPQIFVLHGFSGNGANDMRGMKISKAILERVGQENKITVEVEVPETTYLPFGSTIGTDDVRYINARVFFEGLTPGIYDVCCFLKTVHIECSNTRRDPAKDKITKTEIAPIKNFRLDLR